MTLKILERPKPIENIMDANQVYWYWIRYYTLELAKLYDLKGRDMGHILRANYRYAHKINGD